MPVPDNLMHQMRDWDCSPGHCKKELYEGIDCYTGDCEYNRKRHPHPEVERNEEKKNDN